MLKPIDFNQLSVVHVGPKGFLDGPKVSVQAIGSQLNSPVAVQSVPKISHKAQGGFPIPLAHGKGTDQICLGRGRQKRSQIRTLPLQVVSEFAKLSTATSP